MKLVTKIQQNITAIKYIFLLFISTRIILTIIGIYSRTFLERQYGKQYVWSKVLGLDIWGVWDTFWYLDIAENGYSETGTNPLSKDQANYAFFPLYPMLIRILGKVIGDKYYLAGVILSNVCFIAACIIFYKLVHLTENKKIALRAVKYLFLFPVAFIFSGVFTESLYLLLAVLCFYYAYTRKWLLVGISGFFIALTKSLGVLIIIPLAYEYLRQRNFSIAAIKLDLFFLLLIPVGLLTFAWYNYHLTGDFWAFKDIQSAWGRNFQFPLNVIITGLKKGLFQSNMRDLLEVSFVIISLSLLCLFYKKINFSYLIFGLYSILIPLSTGLDSMPRYILPIFPIYIVLAKLSRNRYFDQVTTISLGLLQGFLMVFWSCGFNLVV